MGKRVLVADDSATIQKAFAMVFAGQVGGGGPQEVNLVAARSLEEAMTAARQARPDLVIADAALGTRTGYELCTAVKADPGLRGVPVYILSSTHTPYDEGKGREAGADGNLIKPFESQSIIDKVTEILARASAPAPIAPSVSSAPPVASAFRPTASGPVPTLRRDPHDEDDDYGDIVIERPIEKPLTAAPAAARSPAAPVVTAPAAMSASAAPPAAPTATPGLRPSLIPGARPGAGFGPRTTLTGAPSPVPNPFAPRPAPAVPAQPLATPVVPSPAANPPSPSLLAAPAPNAPAAVGRTMMGMPAVMIPGVPNRAPAAAPGAPAPTPGMPGATAKPAATPGVTPFASVVPAASPAARPPSAAALPTATAPLPANGAFSESVPPTAARASAAGAVSAKVEQKLSAFAARGPEFEAIARLSREVIEEIVWEVVPELAEIIIREHVERQLKDVGKK
jgi:CheY-like chemotaxis protein